MGDSEGLSLEGYGPEGGDWAYWLNDTEGEEGNGTNNTLVLHSPSNYSTLHIIISSIILTFMMIVVVIGNMLVIIAIATEKTLKNIQNWFIASLAVADFFVGLLIMPFSLANELMGYWIFGSLWCSIHSAMDVLLCTSSIMNICLISLDRYWSITQAVDYLKKRTPGRAAVMIGMVWVLSALISIPPLLGWRDPEAQTNKALPECELSRDIGYVFYSALGSFYIPSFIMVFVYIQIYFAARKRARRGIRKRERPKPKSASAIEEPVVRVTSTASMSGGSSPKAPLSAPPYLVTSPVELNASPRPIHSPTRAVTFQDPLVCTSEIMVKPEITVESPEDSSAERESVRLEDVHPLPGDPDDCSSPEEGELESDVLDGVEELTERPTSGRRAGEDVVEVELTVSELESRMSNLQLNGSSRTTEEVHSSSTSGGGGAGKKAKRPKLHFLRVEKPTTIWRTNSSLSINGDVHILGAVSRCAVVKPLKFRLCQPFFGKKFNSTSAKARRDVLDMGKLPSPKQEIRDPEREKRRIARKKEKRATLILGLIMGSFILCWLPFFFLYIFDPLCPNCVQPWGFAIAFWLGYMNSALNPVIYTIFNKDFRRAFRRILFK